MSRGNPRPNSLPILIAALIVVLVLALYPSRRVTRPGQTGGLRLESGSLVQGPFSLVLLRQNNAAASIDRLPRKHKGGIYRGLPSLAFEVGLKCANAPIETTLQNPIADGKFVYPIDGAKLVVQNLTYKDAAARPIAGPPQMHFAPGRPLPASPTGRIPNLNRPGERHMLSVQPGEIRETAYWWIPPPGAPAPFIPAYEVSVSYRGYGRTGSSPAVVRSLMLRPLGAATPATFIATPLHANGTPAGSPVTLTPRNSPDGATMLEIPACYSGDTAKMEFEAHTRPDDGHTARWVVTGIPRMTELFDDADRPNSVSIANVRVSAWAKLTDDTYGMPEFGAQMPREPSGVWITGPPRSLDTHDKTGVPAIRCVVRAQGANVNGRRWFCTIDSVKPRWASSSNQTNSIGSLLLTAKPGAPYLKATEYGGDAEMCGAFPGQSQDVQVTGSVGHAEPHAEYVTLKVRAIEATKAYPEGVVVWANPQSVTTASGLCVTPLYEQNQPTGVQEPVGETTIVSGARAFVGVRFPFSPGASIPPFTMASFGLFRFVSVKPPAPYLGVHMVQGMKDLAMTPLPGPGSPAASAAYRPGAVEGVPYELGISQSLDELPVREAPPKTITFKFTYYTIAKTPFSLTVPVRDRFPSDVNPTLYDSRYENLP